MTKLTPVLLTAILVAVLINLSLTVYLFMQQSSYPQNTLRESAGLDADISRAWGARVVGLYNRQDHEALYQLFDARAKVKISYQQLKQQLEKLHQLFGDIEASAFVSAARVGEIGSESYYQLLYDVRVQQPGKNSASLKITIVDDDGAISLYGVRINASQSLD